MVKTIFKSKQILLRKKRDLAKNIDRWRKENYKYFKDFDVVNLIRGLRDKNGRP